MFLRTLANGLRRVGSRLLPPRRSPFACWCALFGTYPGLAAKTRLRIRPLLTPRGIDHGATFRERDGRLTAEVNVSRWFPRLLAATTLTTLLHEAAHLDLEGREGHNATWRAVYREIAETVLGTGVLGKDAEVYRAVTLALRAGAVPERRIRWRRW